MTHSKMEESLREELTRAALTHDFQLQALAAQVAIFMARLEEANREGVERSSALQTTASEAVIRTRADLEADFSAISSEVKTGSGGLEASTCQPTFHGKSKQDPYGWFFALDCFFEVTKDLEDPTSRVVFAATLLRDDALKWWWQAKTSGTAEEHEFDRFKAQLWFRFLTTDPVKDARDQLREVKQIQSAKAYS